MVQLIVNLGLVLVFEIAAPDLVHGFQNIDGQRGVSEIAVIIVEAIDIGENRIRSPQTDAGRAASMLLAHRP